MADKQVWDRTENEPNRWFRRFEQFRLFGSNRSIEVAYRLDCEAKDREIKRPSKLWYRIADQWHWRERAEAWDQYLSDKASKDAEALRLEILSTGYAQRHKRVKALNELAELLLGEINNEDKRWLPDVKSIGSGENAERVDIVRFNSALIEQARKTLDDLAAELGERVRGLEISGKDGKPLLPIADLVAALRQADDLMSRDDDTG